MLQIKKSIFILFIVANVMWISLVVVSGETNNYEEQVINYEFEAENRFDSEAIYLSNRFTQQDQTDEFKQNPLVDLEGFIKINDSKHLSLYYKPETLAIRIVNNNNGYIWGSSFNTEHERLNTTWKERVDTPIWISYFRHTTSRDEIVEESIHKSKDTKINTILKNNGFEADISFGESKIKLKLIVTLEDGILKAYVPNNSIEDSSDFMLGNIRIYPFLGAVKTTKEEVVLNGYTLIPDGSGALIRYKSQGSFIAPIYSKALYGRDIGLYRTTADEFRYDEATISLPVYGIVHGVNQNAFYANAKDGKEHARIVSYQSGRLLDFYWTFYEYVYRIQYEQPTSRSVSLPFAQKQRNQFDIILEYSFLNDNEANYVGIANDYKTKLEKENILNTSIEANDINLRIEFLASEMKKGLIFNKKVLMTTTDYMKYVVSDLSSQEINDLTVVVRGWSRKGYHGTSPNYFGFDRKSGGRKGYLNLISALSDENIALYFNANYSKGYKGARGFSTMIDLARKINGAAIDEIENGLAFYYLNPNSSLKIFNKDLRNYNKHRIPGIAFESIGDTLFSSWGRKSVDNIQAINLYQQMASSYNSVVYGSYDYMFPYVDKMFDVPLYSSQLEFFTDTIPFLPLVLKDAIASFSSFSNNFSNPDDEVLRLIDYNVYPSFYITQFSPSRLENTPSQYVNSTQYSIWKNQIYEQYHFVNNALKHVSGKKLISREIVDVGVVKNVYSDNTVIYINYLNNDVTINDLTINAKNYVVEVGG